MISHLENFQQKYISDEECAVISSPISIYYLSGFDAQDGVMLITRNRAFLMVDFRYLEMAKIFLKKSKSDILLKELVFPKDNMIKTILSENHIDKIYFEDKYLTYFQATNFIKKYDIFQCSPLGNAIEEIRKIKTPDEIAFIKAAQRITDLSFDYILNFINKDRTEREIALELEYFMKKNGAQGESFETICVSGKKSSLPHGQPSDIKLEENAFLTMDFGAKYMGYHADMTRTVCLGKATDKMKHVYKTVLRAQEASFGVIKSGVEGRQVDLAARNIINEAGYMGTFGHSLGHSVGLEIHEGPNFSPRSLEIIRAGSVLSVEPGIYLEGELGVRIEDLVVVTEDGFENITSSTKELIEL